ncbi:MAG TPA: hypothetical protein VI821_00040 [Candidatus Paceibacterota bacterium]
MEFINNVNDINNVEEQETDMSILLAQYDADLTEGKIVSFDGDIIQRHNTGSSQCVADYVIFDDKNNIKIDKKLDELEAKINQILEIVQKIAIKINSI